jgi:hypothetical protein
MIKIWERGFLPDDRHEYPDDRGGFYSTTDVCNIFNLKMETFQQWLKDEFVRPAYRLEYGRGMKSVFVRSQLLWIGVFRVLVERGIQRKLAVNWANTFFNMLKSEGSFNAFDLLVVEIDHTGVKNVLAHRGQLPIDSTKDGSDLIVINLNRIIVKINSFV